jgi:hypothetical protein
MPALRTTKAEIKRLTTNPSTKQIIDGLWRAPLWMHDEVLLSPDDEAKTEAGASFDARYVYAENSFLDADDNQVSFASAEGFGNSMQASFAHVIGHFNAATSFAETIIGFHGFVSETQNAHQWIVTDRLFTIANGADANNRSDAFHMYKSGYAVYENAVGIGEYMHGNREPLDGTIQFNGAFSGYYNEAWHTFATAEQLSGLHPAVTIDPNSSTELYLYDGQIIGIDLSAYAKTANLHPAVSLGSGSETELALNPTTQVLTLTGLKKTFLSLNDTFDAYPTTNHGEVLICGTDAVLYADGFGVDAESAWASTSAVSQQYGNECVNNFSFITSASGWTLGSGWTYSEGWQAIEVDSNDAPTAGVVSQSITLTDGIYYLISIGFKLSTGSIEVKIGSETIVTLTAGSTDWRVVDLYYTAPTSDAVTLTLTPSGVSTDMGIDKVSIRQEITVGGSGLRVVDSSHNELYRLPTSAADELDFMVMGRDKRLEFKSAFDLGLISEDFFQGVGLLMKTSEDVFSEIPGTIGQMVYHDGLIWKALPKGTNNQVLKVNSDIPTWTDDTALVDADFASNGLMVRTGAGAYSTVADNSATWNTLASLGTKTFWNGTQAAYDAIGTKDSNTIYFINI